jgi:hypothetical protein
LVLINALSNLTLGHVGKMNQDMMKFSKLARDERFAASVYGRTRTTVKTRWRWHERMDGK